MSIIGTIYEDITTDVAGKIGAWQWFVAILSAILVLPTVLNQHEDAILLTVCHDTNSLRSNKTVCDNWQVRFLWLFWIKRTNSVSSGNLCNPTLVLPFMDTDFLRCLLNCEDNSLLLSTTIVCRLGIVFGCAFFGVIADCFGRRIPIVINVTSELVLRLALTFCGSSSWYRLLVFLKPFFVSANYYLGLTIVCEISSNGWRSMLMSIVIIPYALGRLCLVPLANSAPNQETYNFIAFLVGLIPLAIIRWLPESPQWLLHNGRISIAEKTLSLAAKKNCIRLCDEFKIRPVNYRAYNCLDEEWNCFTILNIRNVRIVVLTLIIIWMLHQYLWSQLYIETYKQEAKYTPLKVFAMIIVVGALNLILGIKVKLRLLLLLNSLVLGILSCVKTYLQLIRVNSIVIDILSSIALASGLISYILLLSITPRLLALQIRCSIFGFCYSAGQIGTIICYFFHSKLQDDTKIIVTAVMTFILICLCCILPDVDGRELPDTINDMDYFSELSKPLRWAAQKTNSPSREEIQMRVYSFNNGQNSENPEHKMAKPIGFIRIWYLIIKCCRSKNK